ncbi:uncharacterized protein LOC113294841 [Papaver somniferum]|uniref:uncharacterized protein LOC113294841 n=1 Tax=Papaver somniferum TaxID=3469 RepID=UPI000E702077|nr:uncharacterized protein LOC113294841 [Papaver somniferum]
MKHVLSGLISPNQSAFISGRSIQDNIMVAHEIVRNYHRTKGTPRCTLKVDLKKAYDTVSWEAIVWVLQRVGFPSKFIDWISLYFSTSRFSVMVNGSPYGFSGAKRGLRQGRPLSPYLFVLVMEIFSASLLHQSLNCALEQFSNCSGLVMNKLKTPLYSSAVDEEVLDQIVLCLGCTKGELPVRYLGVPLLSTRLSYKDCIPLLNKFDIRIKSWKTIFLAYPGRALLIKAVLAGMINFWCSCFVLPERVIKELNTKFNRFFWDGPDMGKKHSPISWVNVCHPYEEGGLGVKDLEFTNVAANFRHIWELISGKTTIWTECVKYNLIKDKDFWSLNVPQEASWCWRRILDHRDLARKFIGVTIDDGTSLNFMKDNWHPKGRIED